MPNKKTLKDYIDSIFDFYTKNGIYLGTFPKIEIDNT